MARFAAPEVKADYVPAFVVEKLEGTYKRTVHKWVKNEGDSSGKIVETEVEEPRGYMVHFPRGHSTHVATEKELARLGLDIPMVPLISVEDTDDDKPKGYVPNDAMKEKRK